MAFSWNNDKPRKAKVFSQYSDDFYLDENGVLQKKDIPVDDQAVIDSFFDTRLEKILDLYSDQIDALSFNGRVEFDEAVVEIDQNRSKLDAILAGDAVLDDYRRSDPSLADLSRDELISKLRGTYKAAVEAYKNKIYGGVPNEAQKATGQAEQEVFHSDGSSNES